MKDIAKSRNVPDSIRRVVETMALAKMDLVKSLRLMHIRERYLERLVDKHRTSNKTDKIMADYIAQNPNFNIIIENDSQDS